MKLKDVLKTITAILFTVILLSCGGGGGGGDEPVTGISGRITIGGVYFAGVTVTLSGTASATATTNSSGYYLFTGLANGDYTITPTKTNCTFTPTDSGTLTFSGASITQNFTAVVTPAIAAGGNHSLALKSDGTVWAWGLNTNGQLGDGTVVSRSTPVPVSGLSGIIAIAAGGNHSLAVRGNGTVWAWGLNANGQIGDNSTTDSRTPVNVSGLSGIAVVAAGGNHSLALTTAGGVKAWGYNAYGQLGDGTVTRKLTPVDVSGLTSGVTAIAAGNSHSLALTTGGGVKAWGLNGNGQLGDNSVTNSTTAVNVSGLSTGTSAIAAGGYHSLALTTGGAVLAWGFNSNGQLGDGTITERRTPVSITSLSSGIDAIAAGGYHSLALSTDGAVYAWGLNTSGQLGDTTTTERREPVGTDTLTSDVDAISAGGYHSLALPDSGGVKAWGLNGDGQLGNSTTTNSLTPIDVNSF